MEQLFDIQFYYDQFILSRNWLVENALALSIASSGQLLVIGLLFLAARLISKYAQILLSELAKTPRFDAPLRWISTPQRWIAVTLFPIALPILWLILQWLALAVFSYFDLPNQFIRTAVNLIAAWIVIRFSTSFVRNAAISRIIAGIAWTIAALNIVGLLTPTVQLLDSQAFNLGGLRISAMTVINALLSLSVMLWLAIVAERFLEQRVMSSLSLSPSMQVLIVKLFKIFVVTAAVLVALYAVGIDLTVFAVFSGAIGIGIGFGLQKAVANFVSGITILVERSIKLGDVISVGETYGWVNTLGARFVSVLTRDGIEYLIPNEDLLTQQVINWSYSNNQVRLKVPVGISYQADVHKAIALCIEAAKESPRVLAEPAPVCLLKGFGDNAVELEQRFWIRDARNGVTNVKSEVLLRIWDKFKANNIEIPFPQRDLHFKSPLKVDVTTHQNDVASAVIEGRTELKMPPPPNSAG